MSTNFGASSETSRWFRIGVYETLHCRLGVCERTSKGHPEAANHLSRLRPAVEGAAIDHCLIAVVCRRGHILCPPVMGVLPRSRLADLSGLQRKWPKSEASLAQREFSADGREKRGADYPRRARRIPAITISAPAI